MLVGLGGFDALAAGGLAGNMMNDDLAMGAPPGAPGATVDIAAPGLLSETSEGEADGEDGDNDMDLDDDDNNQAGRSRSRGRRTDGGATPRTSIGDATPRAPIPPLPATAGAPPVPAFGNQFPNYHPPIRRPPNPGPDSQPAHGRVPGRTFTVTVPPGIASASVRPPSNQYHTVGNSSKEEVPYREDDVLLSLQLLAYLSKYPHVRQAFYKPRSVLGEGEGLKTTGAICAQTVTKEAEKEKESTGPSNPFLKVFGVAKREKEKVRFY